MIDTKQPVARYAGVDMNRYTIEWLIEPDTTGMLPFEKIRALAYKERIPIGTPLYISPTEELRWIDLAEKMPEPELFVLTWDGFKVGVDFWGSLRYRRAPDGGPAPTHWMPFPKPPGAGPMYGMHSYRSSVRD